MGSVLIDTDMPARNAKLGLSDRVNNLNIEAACWCSSQRTFVPQSVHRQEQAILESNPLAPEESDQSFSRGQIGRQITDQCPQGRVPVQVLLLTEAVRQPLVAEPRPKDLTGGRA